MATSCAVTNINARIVYKTATSDKFIYHEIGKTAALPSSMVAASARSLGWGDRQPQEIACDKCATLLLWRNAYLTAELTIISFFRCEEWFFADKVGLTPEAFDLLGQGDKKWYCPKCKEKKAKKKAKKRQRERGGSPEAKQPRLKIKMGGMFGK